MDKNILTNFYRLLVFIRFDIHRYENKMIIDIMVDALLNNYSNRLFVKEATDKVLQHKMSNDDSYDFLTLINENHVDIEQKEKILRVLIPIMEKIQFFISTNAYDEAYAVVNMAHALVEAFANEKTKYLGDFWEIFMEPLISKWEIYSFNELREYFINVTEREFS